jgi:transcription elongation factor Elf1
MENKYIMFNYYSSLTDDRGNILGEIDERIICNKCGSNNLDFCINKKQKEIIATCKDCENIMSINISELLDNIK